MSNKGMIQNIKTLISFTHKLLKVILITATLLSWLNIPFPKKIKCI